MGAFTDYNITITPADAITYLPTGTPVTINAYPSLPSAVDGTFTITSLALLGTADTTIPDGVYLFEIEATADEELYEFSFYAVYYEITECCIQSLVMEAVTCGCSGNSEKIQKLNFAMLQLSTLRPVVFNGVVGDSYVVENELWTDAAEILVSLNDICQNENCGGCGGCG